jgi:hypothetical protein
MKLALVLSTLGLTGTPSRLTWGALDLSAATPFDKCGSRMLTRGPGPLHERSSAALFLKTRADTLGYHVWSTATTDPGDQGPFRSQIFHAGDLRRVQDDRLFRYAMLAAPAALWSIDGSKIEALARAPSAITGAGLALASDDEDYVGVWRPLPSRKKAAPERVRRMVRGRRRVRGVRGLPGY